VYHQRVGDLTAFILAGGLSSRMGRDKAFLELGGRTLLDHATALAGSVAPHVRVVAPQERFLTVTKTIEDVFPGCGPLGGIHAALTHTATELNLVLAVDLPLIEPRFLAYLASQASQTGAVVTVPNAAGGWQPLCAVYRRDFAPVAEAALKKKKCKIDSLFSRVQTRVLAHAELTRMGFSVEMFRNLNTPDDFRQAERLFEQRQ
jgi:molybdopterin-guanine dinucleotide biosynthesis protein A